MVGGEGEQSERKRANQSQTNKHGNRQAELTANSPTMRSCSLCSLSTDVDSRQKCSSTRSMRSCFSLQVEVGMLRASRKQRMSLTLQASSCWRVNLPEVRMVHLLHCRPFCRWLLGGLGRQVEQKARWQSLHTFCHQLVNHQLVNVSHTFCHQSMHHSQSITS